LTDLKTVVEASAVALKMPMNAVLERIGTSEADWGQVPPLSTLLHAAETVGLEVGFSASSEHAHEAGQAIARRKAEAAPPSESPGTGFPSLRPSWPIGADGG
jgi:hypothetical protein